MNDIERIEKTLHDVIDYLISTSGEATKREVLKDIRRNLIAEPTQPEGYQGLNKWYKSITGAVLFAEKDTDNFIYGYGLSGLRCWATSGYSLNKELIIRLATETEKKEAILKGCEQHGIVEGARVKCLYNEEILTVPTIIEIDYQTSINNAWIVLKKENDLINIFDNGKFAEVVKDEKEKYRLGRKQQRAILETQTGKEYLLFPQGHEDTARCFLRYLNGGDLSKNELIKIIGSLNKPSVNMIDCDEAKKLKELLKECETLLTGIFNGSSYISEIDPLLVKLKKHLNND